MIRIAIAGSDVTACAEPGTSLLTALQRAAYPVATSCGGSATCGLCRLAVTSGRELLTPLVPAEITHLGSIAKVLGLRLACQARCLGAGDVRVEVPEIEDVAARKARKAERLRAQRDRGGPR